MTSHPRLVIHRRADGLFDFRVITHDGEIVVVSAEGFTRPDDAVEAANREFPEFPAEIEDDE